MMQSRRRAGFTLMEVVLAMLLVSLLAYSLYSAMHIAIVARRSAVSAVEPVRAVVIAADLMRQDLESVMPPVGIYAGQFLGTHVTGQGGDNDSLQFFSMGEDVAAVQRQKELVAQAMQQPTGQSLQQDDPLAEGFRKVELAVRSDVNPPVLVRRVQRNLEPSGDPKVEEEIICRDVRSFSLRYFDGTNWQTDWDSTVMGDVLPLSVAMTVELNDPANPPPARSSRRVTRIIPLACGRELDLATATAGGVP
jgi:prepilin-type N-terminal cleavage/methylation domain-containing protein